MIPWLIAVQVLQEKSPKKNTLGRDEVSICRKDGNGMESHNLNVARTSFGTHDCLNEASRLKRPINAVNASRVCTPDAQVLGTSSPGVRCLLFPHSSMRWIASFTCRENRNTDVIWRRPRGQFPGNKPFFSLRLHGIVENVPLRVCRVGYKPASHFSPWVAHPFTHGSPGSSFWSLLDIALPSAILTQSLVRYPLPRIFYLWFIRNAEPETMMFGFH